MKLTPEQRIYRLERLMLAMVDEWKSLSTEAFSQMSGRRAMILHGLSEQIKEEHGQDPEGV